MSIRLVAAAALCAGLSFAAPPVLAQQAGDANAGIRVYKEFGNCWDCHGWSGLGGLPHVGGDHDGEDAGPPIIRSTLTTAAMIEMVACGKPDGRHPAFAAGAWTEMRRCYGKTSAQLGPNELLPPRSEIKLTEGQIINVVAWVQDALQGKTMTKANCLRYFSVAQSIVCDVFP